MTVDARQKNHSRQNNMISDISMLRTLSMLEGDKSAMFLLTRMGHNTKYVVLKTFASPSTIVIKLSNE